MSTFETDIWTIGLDQTRTAGNAAGGGSSENLAQQGATGTGAAPRKASLVYRILHPSAAGPTGFGRSRRYNSDSSYGASDSESDAGSVHSRESGGGMFPSLGRGSGSGAKKLGGLFGRAGAGAQDSDSEAESDSERAAALAHRAGRMSIKGFLGRKASARPAEDVDSGGSDAEKHGGGAGNIFRSIMGGPRKASVASRGSNASLNRPHVDAEQSRESMDRPAGKLDQPRASLDLPSSTQSLSRTSSAASLSDLYGVPSSKELGRGASAVVRLCSPVNSDKKFAIKEFTARRKGEEQRKYIKRITSEFCISQTLIHENVIRTLDLIQDDAKKWCLVMEFCEGGDMFSVIESGKLTEPMMDCFFKQLLKGVAYLHSAGVAHRDLKPENLILDGPRRILKITDFGVSVVFRLPLETGNAKFVGEVGSGPYMAPESFSGQPYAAELMDIWSCGIIYYVMYFNSIPWMSSRPNDQRFKFYKDHWGKFAPIDRLISLKKKVMYDMLQPDPTRRIQVASILGDDWMKSVVCCETGMPAEASGHSHQELNEK
ncbi:serine/threonine-protein kinase HAL4/sat4 [Podochytrium sp. JEL0797]|nr:serine/threonine-protein kinase HAL4/sat4 [Podochytrium sp. JEL0797]